MANEYTHRMDKLLEMQDHCISINLEGQHFSSLLMDKIESEKKSLLSNLIKKINKDSVFDDAIYLQSIGVKQFYEVLKKKLQFVDEKQSFLNDFEMEKNEQEQKEAILKIESLKENQNNLIKLVVDYPNELKLIFSDIFSIGLIRDQEDVLDLRNISKFDSFFNKKKRVTSESINLYYQIYDQFQTLTEGSDLYKEYKEYKSLTQKKEAAQREMFRANDNLKALQQEKSIFEKDLEELKKVDDFEKIREETIKDFVIFSHQIDNIDFYIGKIVMATNDKESLKKLIQLQRQKGFFLFYLKIFNEIDSELIIKVKELQQSFKSIAFCKMEKIDFPYFSNIGYFENRLLYYKEGKKEFFNFFNNKNIIKTENIDEFENNLIKNMNKNIMKDFLALKSDFEIFEEKELQVLDKQIKNILKIKSK